MSNNTPYQNIRDAVYNDISKQFDIFFNAFEIISKYPIELDNFLKGISSSLNENYTSYIKISALCKVFEEFDITTYSNSKTIIENNFPKLAQSQKDWESLYQEYLEKAIKYREEDLNEMFQNLASDLREKIGLYEDSF